MNTSPVPAAATGWLASLPTLGTLERHKRLVGAILLLVPLAAAIQGCVAENRYVSRASILIKLGREFQSPAAAGGRTTSMFRINEVLNSEIEILTSRSLVGDVLDRLGLELLYPAIAEQVDDVEDQERARAKGLAKFLESLTVSGITDSSVIEVAFAHPDPSVAKEALAVLVECFEARHVAVFGVGTLPLAERQMTEALIALEEAEAARTAYRAEHAIFDENEQRALLLRRRDALDSARGLLAGRFERLRGDDAAPLLVGAKGDSEMEATIESELLRLQAEDLRLLENYQEGSRTVASLREQIRLQESLLRRVRENSAAELGEQLAALDQDLASIDATLRALASHASRLRELDRNVQRLEAHHLAAVASVSAARLEAELDAALVSSVRLIDPPTLPIEPIGLGLAARLVLGIIAGLLCAASAVLIVHLRETRQYSAAAATT